ncbi:hypothetical protein [Arthrobacter alpinus]|uniref:hypothetical protein n=1 Tax=Arthrobacter alpinus TaxID=656366 RepID=UPI00164700BD|nr:hypothetical protein [Arthrobacter alpinus]
MTESGMGEFGKREFGKREGTLPAVRRNGGQHDSLTGVFDIEKGFAGRKSQVHTPHQQFGFVQRPGTAVEPG